MIPLYYTQQANCTHLFTLNQLQYLSDVLQKTKHAARVVTSIVREKIKSNRRSARWDEIRDHFLKENFTCAACGSTKRLQVHHVLPFSNRPDLELEFSNLITLCMDVNECHFRIGHGGSFKHYNPNVIADSAAHLAAPEETRRLIVENSKVNRLD